MTTLRCEDFTLTVEEPVKQLGAKRLADGSVVFACEHTCKDGTLRFLLHAGKDGHRYLCCGPGAVPEIPGVQKAVADDLRDSFQRAAELVGRSDQWGEVGKHSFLGRVGNAG